MSMGSTWIKICTTSSFGRRKVLHASAIAINRDPWPNLRGGEGRFKDDRATVFAFSNLSSLYVIWTDGFHVLTFYDLGLLCIGQRPTVAAETSWTVDPLGSFGFTPISNVS